MNLLAKSCGAAIGRAGVRAHVPRPIGPRRASAPASVFVHRLRGTARNKRRRIGRAWVWVLGWGFVMDRTLVFVYGTLKRDFPNYGLIEDLIRSGDASFVSAGRTAARLPLVVGPWGIPFLLPLPGSGRRVSGELFAVSARGLARIDDLEGTHRGHYERLPVAVVPNPGGGGDEDEEAVEAEAYYAHRRYAAEMWRRSGETGLRVYSEEDALGYVRRNERPRDTTFLGQIRIFLASDN